MGFLYSVCKWPKPRNRKVRNYAWHCSFCSRNRFTVFNFHITKSGRDLSNKWWVSLDKKDLLSQACFDKPMRSISLLKKHALILELKKKNDIFCFLFLFLSANVNRWVPSWRPIWSEAQGSNVNYGKSLNTEETFKLIYDSKQKKKLLKKMSKEQEVEKGNRRAVKL